MQLLLVIIFCICAPIVVTIYIGKGCFALSAKRYLIQGAELARRCEYESARRAVIIAARQNPEFKKNADVQSLYEIILAKSTNESIAEIDRILAAISTWKKTRPEIIVESEAFKVGIIIFIIIWILVKLVG